MSTPPSMSDRDGKIWMDGQMVDWRDAKIHVLTHTLHYGCGAFEGVRAYKTVKGTAIFRLRSTPSACSTAPRSCACPCRSPKTRSMRRRKAVVRENKLEAATCAR
jgi:branched-chain amino acid aminotransferase